MEIKASDLMDLPITHQKMMDFGFMFETIDHDDEGETARWRIVFDYDTGRLISKNTMIIRATSNWSI